MITIDLETEAIVGNPTVAPPRPVGVAIKYDNQPAVYHAWGHPTENNTTYELANAALQVACGGGEPLLFHNAKFDLAVMRAHFGAAPARPELVHDTMYSIFLTDPYAASMALKPSADRILGLPPEEQDELRAWILAHVPEAKKKPTTWGAYIARAPAALVGRYACGDVDRTKLLHDHTWTTISGDAGTARSYRREQLLLPILARSEARGIRVDAELLLQDCTLYTEALVRIEQAIWQHTGCCFNLDSGDELADVLEQTGRVVEFEKTAKGKRSTAKDALERCCTDLALLPMLRYHGALSTMVGTFMGPWLAQCARYGGRIHTQWNSVRQARGAGNAGNAGNAGTRTGRLSSFEPNFQNIPNTSKLDLPGYPPLPVMRKYLLPEVGHVWLSRDYDSQEMRILAEMTEGRLYQRYQADPAMDAHAAVAAIIKEELHQELERKHVKITGFGILYGEGTTALSRRMGVAAVEGLAMREAYFKALPEVRGISKETKRLGQDGKAIRTWGGRKYYTEPGKLKNGRIMDYSYKLLNYLIQGSAADCTKDGIIAWDGMRGADDVFLATVHDENNASAPEETKVQSMAALKRGMGSVAFSVPMLSTGKWGPTWGELSGCE